MPDQNPARRFKLANKIEALSRGARVIYDNLGSADDATVVAALRKLEAEVTTTRKLADIIAELAPHEKRDVDGAGPVVLQPGQTVVVAAEAEGEDV